jgi:hypothetical protein
MNTESFKPIVGNEVVARIAFQLNEVVALILSTELCRPPP